jgi:hypothetical protein
MSAPTPADVAEARRRGEVQAAGATARPAELLAAEPGQQDGRRLVPPRQGNRAAGVDDDHGAGVGGGDPVDELVLPARQRQRDPVEAFALDLVAGADDHHGGVGVAGQRDGVVELLVVRERRHRLRAGRIRAPGAWTTSTPRGASAARRPSSGDTA